MQKNEMLQQKLQPYFIRAQVIKAIRAFFEQQQFYEVIAPVLNHAVPLEPNLFPFTTQWQTTAGEQTLYLSTSPEAALKKMLAAGIGNCFSFAKAFRNFENRGERHNPEFLMLEWYREGADYHQIMEDVEELVVFVRQWVKKWQQGKRNQEKNRLQAFIQKSKTIITLPPQPWPRLSLDDLCQKHLGLDLAALVKAGRLEKFARQQGYHTTNSSWHQLFDQVFLNEIEPHLPQTPFFLTDFPAKISPLCKQQGQRPYLAQRFEYYLCGVELANGNTEELDAIKVGQRFQKEQKYRQDYDCQHQQKQYPKIPPYDQEFLQVLKRLARRAQQQKLTYAGVGLGVDRLAMVLAGVTEIDLVEPFVLKR